MDNLIKPSLPIITAQERMQEPKGVTACIFGKSGIGKTSLLKTLPEQTTLFVDLEAGDLSVKDWRGDAIRPRTWQEYRNLAAFIGGPNPALRDQQAYSRGHYEAVCKLYGDPCIMSKYENIFIDSITVAARLCFYWCQGQPQAMSERTGKPDTRAAYGLHGSEMISWLTQLQHTRNKNIFLVGILDEKIDECGRITYSLQLEGSKTALALPGIFDQIITMAEIKSVRALICHTLNDFGYPAKDRSGRLECLEEPNLGKLIAKIKGQAALAIQSTAFTTANGADHTISNNQPIQIAS